MHTIAEQIRSMCHRRESLATELSQLDAELSVIRDAITSLTPSTAPGAPPPISRTHAGATSTVRVNEHTDRTAAIEALLKDGPQSTKDIAAHLGHPKLIVKMALQRMKRIGRLVQLGHGNGTRWALPGTGAPTTKRLADVVNPQVGDGPACRICECAFSTHDPTNGRCYGKSGKCVCREFRS